MCMLLCHTLTHMHTKDHTVLCGYKNLFGDFRRVFCYIIIISYNIILYIELNVKYCGGSFLISHSFITWLSTEWATVILHQSNLFYFVLFIYYLELFIHILY